MCTDKLIHRLIIVTLLSFFPFLSLFAEAPARVNYQGRLKESGLPANGTKTMLFSIYTQPSGGSLLWSSGAMSVEVSSGLFRAVLTPSDIDLKTYDCWLEVHVDGVPLVPREQINASFYSLYASSANYAYAAGNVIAITADRVTAGPFAPGSYEFPGSVTAASMTVTGNAFSVGASTLAVVNGNVGIGTADPTATLYVVGTSTITSDLSVGGNLVGAYTVQGSTGIFQRVAVSSITFSDGTIMTSTGAFDFGMTAAQVIIDGAGSWIRPGPTNYCLRIPYRCKITKVTVIADQPLTTNITTIDLWKSSYASAPPVNAGSLFDSGGRPTLAVGAQKLEYTAFDAGEDIVNAGDVITLEVEDNYDALVLNVILDLQRY